MTVDFRACPLKWTGPNLTEFLWHFTQDADERA